MKILDPIDAVLRHVKKQGSITNRECRQFLALSYDQTIFLLGGLCKVGLLVRKGAASGTHYILSDSPVSLKAVSEFKEMIMKRLS